MEEYRVDRPGRADDAVRPEAERLQAALEALAARDQVLADRNRRLAYLEGVVDRLTALAARLEEAEAELGALRRARAADAAAAEERVSQLERRLAAGLAPADTAVPPSDLPPPAAPSDDDAPALLTRLEGDLESERRRNARLAARRDDGTTFAARLRGELNEALRRVAGLEQQLSGARQAAGPGGAYAHWEQWFRQRLAERAQTDLARADEALRRQRAVLEEKERLIARLIERLRAVGEVREGPDDLKEIVGIGPVIEDLLHSLGITSFEQLAALSEEEVDRIEGRLGAFHERVRRDRWVEQAAALAARRVRLGPGLSLV